MFWKDVWAGIGMGLVLPALVLNFGVMLLEQPLADTTDAAVQADETLQPVCVTEADRLYEPVSINLRDSEGKIQSVNLEDYLVGVVLAEMPAWFEAEALKAQAVVARTYTLKNHTTGGKHGDGSICTQSGCCQAYIHESDYIKRGGDYRDVEKIRSAVQQTAGLVVLYDGELIDATYFSCSGGRTEDAQAVWGTAYPYLQSVESPGEENASHYMDAEFLTAEDICKALEIQPDGDPEDWIGDVQYTNGGGIACMDIGGRQFHGVELRNRLGLRSTVISMEARGDGILVTTKGFGHRVGMSQYGADAMAIGGSSFSEILSHYYTGTSLEIWPDGNK